MKKEQMKKVGSSLVASALVVSSIAVPTTTHAETLYTSDDGWQYYVVDGKVAIQKYTEVTLNRNVI